MKKLIVKDDVCIGCGACVAIDALHFDFDENGLSSVISNENVETGEVVTAINSCPVNAIKLIDETGEDCQCDGKCEHCEHHAENWWIKKELSDLESFYLLYNLFTSLIVSIRYSPDLRLSRVKKS